MKIQCDVCDKEEASVFCTADEAALCSACDHRVHHANKLAGKHSRFSLQRPSTKQLPICDICKERRAFLFCQQDRAIMCRECDVPIHNANELTQKHTRFLLTGLNISATSAIYSAPASSNSDAVLPDTKSRGESNKNRSVSRAPTSTPTPTQITAVATPASCDRISNAKLTSSISEYMEMLPGWHVEDFLDPGFCKNGESEVLPFWDVNLGSNMDAFSTERMGLWVPQVPPPVHHTRNQSYHQSKDIYFGATNGLIKEQFDSSNNSNNSIKFSRKWIGEDNSFAVPVLMPPSTTVFKRSRTLL